MRLVLQRAGGRTEDVTLDAEDSGYYSARVPGIGAGTRYRYQIDGRLFADPASRYQPEGPFGPSEVVDPSAYRWGDAGWRGAALRGQVFCEMHIGTFTPEGTWRAAMDRLESLRDVGITAVEVMPVAEFAGRFGWGYDGVFLYAPTHLYGAPDDFKAFVDRAHEVGLAVILDVVYNHFGPSGCVHREFAEQYFTDRYDNEWGDALDFDGPDTGPVREHFVSNAPYWVGEYHVDGLRLDAIQGIHDSSPEHIVAEATRLARAAAGHRPILVIVENEKQHSFAIRPPDQGGYGVDAAWNDDFHHSAAVMLIGRRQAYFSDHAGRPQEFISAAKYGYLFQGQRYAWQGQARGTPGLDLPPAAFVNYLDNHDQIANAGDGARIYQHSGPGMYRALKALLLLMPGTPLLFQGEEFGATSPFLYFADHEGELAEAVRRGRAEFVRQFPRLASPEAQARLPLPHDPATFARCKLDWSERDRHTTHVRLHTDLLALRRDEAAFRAQARDVLDGAVLGAAAFVLRYHMRDPRDERLLVVNLGIDYLAESFPEPLMAPPAGYAWRTRWSSDHPDYGGVGVPRVVMANGWCVPGYSAVVLAPDGDGRSRT